MWPAVMNVLLISLLHHQRLALDLISNPVEMFVYLYL